MIKELINSKIFERGGHRVMFDFDLSALYNVETRTLKQAVRRNIQRFPKDFMIELITICDNLPESAKYSPVPPFAFTEQGIAMLSTVLKSEKAIQVNIAIIRAFVFIRQYALNHQDLSERLDFDV